MANVSVRKSEKEEGVGESEGKGKIERLKEKKRGDEREIATEGW